MYDRIRWADVFPDVDFEVRYIHDIMKVDVIVKQNRLKEISAQHANGFLTAKFEIPSVLIRSEAKQGDVTRDLYSEAFDIDPPLAFERDGKVIHKMRPVVAYSEVDGEAIGGKQTWQLNQDGSGHAELSVAMNQVAQLPEGDLVIDPSMDIVLDYQPEDTWLDYSNPTTNYGSSGIVSIERDDRFIYGVTVLNPVSPHSDQLSGRNILSATLELSLQSVNLDGHIRKYRAYKITEAWDETYATWISRDNYGLTWTDSGGTFENQNYASKPIEISDNDYNERVVFDVTQIFKSHYATHVTHPQVKGYMIKREDSDGFSGNYISIRTSNHSIASHRPKLTVEYAAAQFEADIGGDYHSTLTVLQRVNDAKSDNFDAYRYFAGNEGTAAAVQSFVQSVDSNAKLVLVFPINGTSNYATTTDYVNKLSSYLTPISSYMGSTVVGVQFGNEEESSWGSNPYPPHTLWYGNQANGRLYADYFIAGSNYVKQNWPSVEILSGSINHAESLKWPVGETVNPFGSSGEFFKGFILECQEQGNYTNDLLPDTMTIHHYHGNSNPENSEYTDPKEYTEFKERLHEFYNVCNDLGYIPNFAITEYGFSPTAYNQYAPNTNASQISQAVYYTRFSLMQATSGNNTGSLLKGIGWKYNFYFQHPQNPNDTAFHAPGTGYGADRKIRGIAQNLFSSSIGLNDPETTIVTPVNTVNFSGNVFKGWCAWKNINTSSAATDEVWAAVWLYNRSIDFNSISETTGSFTIDGDYSGWSYNIKQFNMTNTPATFDNKSVSPAPTITPSSGKTTIQFTSNTLSHNPVFIRFYR